MKPITDEQLAEKEREIAGLIAGLREPNVRDPAERSSERIERILRRAATEIPARQAGSGGIADAVIAKIERQQISNESEKDEKN